MYFFALLTLSLSLSQTVFAANPWGAARAPASGPAESIGTPTAGCVKGALPLSNSTAGIVLTRPERRRNFGHPRLVQLLSDLAAARAQKKIAPLFLGDIGQARGGPTMSAHASHQTGLDADLLYVVPEKWNYGARKNRVPAAASVVDSRTRKTNRNFGPRQVELLRSFAENDQIDRVLVNYAVKRALCDQHASEPWIRKVRPWYGHDHHFHIRAKCAASDLKCKAGEPIPAGNGCDETLAWWWSDDAKLEAGKNLHKQSHPVMPELPAECTALIATHASR